MGIFSRKTETTSTSTTSATGFTPEQQASQVGLQARVISNWRQPATAKKTAKREARS
ncbi:hypothetical protein ACFWP3_16920 [Streptomyces sp. NPDC058525]|uniref:hypothetical protein n=1 Tax=Streptomyces sp. NPDC058525 TaxID=3346538 RepID=UPI00364B5ABD